MQEWVEELEVLIVSENKQVEIRHLLYDEAKDFFWAEGFLWIILEVKLKVIEKNEWRSIDFKCFENLTDCLNYVKEIRACKNPDLSALEIINPKVAGYLNLEKKYYILVEYENSIDWSIKDQEEIKNIRGKRDACYAVTVNAWFDQIEDPEINEWEEEFFNRFEQHDIPIFGHIGIWVLHPHFRSEQKNLEKEMYELVQKLWGNVSWEHGIGKKKRVYLSKENQEKMENLKRKRDPTNIFWF